MDDQKQNSERINEAYGSEIISEGGGTFIGEEADSDSNFTPVKFTAVISGDLNGSLICFGINDVKSKQMYLEDGCIYLDIDYGRIDETARLFASIVSVMTNEDFNKCESAIEYVLTNTDFNREYAYGDVDLGSGSSAYVRISQDQTQWIVNFGSVF